MAQQYSIVQVTALPNFPKIPTSCTNDLKKKDKQIPASDYEVIGGLLSNEEYAWKAHGPHFTIYNCKMGTKVAAWSFGLVIRDYATKVVCVDELRQFSHKLPLLVIGLSCEFSGGMICIFDIIGSRVLRSIQINEQVSSLHMIDASFDMCPLPGPLRAFDGILTVGTASGNVLLLDICRQTCEEVYNSSGLNHIRDEINSCNINIISLNEVYSIELQKQDAIKNDQHLSIHLNATEELVEHFILKGPKGENRLYVNKEEVIVSALHYCPQLGSLLVGYNFGAWQLWNLINLQLVYTSPVCEGNTPVSHFALQEPCDDPKAFCYIWVVYSNKDKYEVSFPIAILYSLNYESKEWHEGYGILYQDLGSCTVRFQVDLLLSENVMVKKNTRQSSYCLALQAISKSNSRGSVQEYQEETLSLCSIVWTSLILNSKLESQTHMILFDLNQWYKAQMPSLPRSKNCETYMSRVCLNELLQTTKLDQVLDVRINVDTLTQFFGSQKLEEHYYPSSLAFKLHTLKENDVIIFNNKGSQRALLGHLESIGPSVLSNPTEYYLLSIRLGLTPIFVDLASGNCSSLEFQREYLLNIALEQHLIGWLYKCIVAWSTGSHSAVGCTLHFLLCWGWKRAQTLKQNVDKLTITLFDYSGIRLDENAHNLLINCSRQLKNIHSLFELVNKKYLPFLINPDVVKQQYESLQMVSTHIEVLQWLLHVGFLPECPISSYPRADKYNRISVPYPVDELIKYYNDRRAQLQSLYSKHFVSKDSPLFIDNLIDLECGGVLLQKQWENDGGSGIYPPTSLQALLRTYLIENVDISVKHSIIFYVFLDLVMILNQNRYKSTITHLIKFPAVFQLSPSLIKIIQAFWQLDHGEFGCAMEQLIDPLISKTDLKMWHHRIVLKSFFIQEQYNFALLYLQIWQPPITEIDDVCIVISLFVAKNMLDEALHFQREYSCTEIEEKLLHHFYKECDRREVISSILNFPFTKKEEEIFVKYLEDVKHPNLKHLQLSYYMQRSRYIDAFKLTAANNVTAPTGNKASSSKHGVGLQNSVLNIMREAMPEFTKSVMNHCWKNNNSAHEWKTVPRPEPFSVFVHHTNIETKYKSTLIHAGLVKSQETWTHPILEKNAEKNITINTEVENIPFLNTPKAVPEQPRIVTPLIFPKIINLDVDYNGVSLPKKLKLSPRLSISVPKINEEAKIDAANNDSILNTPMIKRKILKKSPISATEDAHISQSILKVKNTTSDSGGTVRVRFDDSSLQRKTPSGLTPRKPIPRTSRPNVHFDVLRTPSESSFTSTSSGQSFKIFQETAVVHSPKECHISNLPETSKTGTSIEEDFYTPRSSINSNLESKECSPLEDMDVDEIEVVEEPIFNDSKLQTSVKSRRSYRSEGSFYGQDVDIIKLCDEIDDTLEESRFSGILEKSSILQTPKSRKTYKDESEFSEYECLSNVVSVDVSAHKDVAETRTNKSNIIVEVDKSMEKSSVLETSSSKENYEDKNELTKYEGLSNRMSIDVSTHKDFAEINANKPNTVVDVDKSMEKSTLLETLSSKKSCEDESEFNVNEISVDEVNVNKSNIAVEESKVMDKSIIFQTPRSRKSYKGETEFNKYQNFINEVSIDKLINEDIDASDSDSGIPVTENYLLEFENVEKIVINSHVESKDITDAVLDIQVKNDDSVSLHIGKESGDTEIDSLKQSNLDLSATDSKLNTLENNTGEDVEENKKPDISITELNESLCTAETETEIAILTTHQTEKVVECFRIESQSDTNLETTRIISENICNQEEPISDANLQISETKNESEIEIVLESDTNLAIEQENESKEQKCDEILEPIVNQNAYHVIEAQSENENSTGFVKAITPRLPDDQQLVNSDSTTIATKEDKFDDDEIEIIEIPSSDEEVEDVTFQFESDNYKMNVADEQDSYTDESCDSENLQNIAIQSINYSENSNCESSKEENKCDSVEEITSNSELINTEMEDVVHKNLQLEVIPEEISDESSNTSDETTDSVQIISSTTKSEASVETKSQQLETIPVKEICKNTLENQFFEELELPSSTVQTTTEIVDIDQNEDAIICKSSKTKKTNEIVVTAKSDDTLDTSWNAIKDPIKSQEDNLLDSTAPLLNSSLFKDSINCDGASITWMDKMNFNNFNETDILDHTVYTSESKNNKNLDSPGPSTYDIFTPAKTKANTPARRSKRLLSLQATSTPDQNKKVNRRSASFDSFYNIDDSLIVNTPPSTSRTPAKRKHRSASVDIAQPSTRTLRNTSKNVDVDVEIKKVQPVKKTQKMSTYTLNVTSIEEYTASRRLTRRQMSFLQKSLGTNIFTGETSLLVPNNKNNSPVKTEGGVYLGTRRRTRSIDNLDLSKPELEIIYPKLRRTRQSSEDSDYSDISIISQNSLPLGTNRSPEIYKRRTRSTSGRLLDTSIQKEQKNLQSKLVLPKIAEDKIVVSDTDSDVTTISGTCSLTAVNLSADRRRRWLKSTDKAVRRSERILASKVGLPEIKEEQVLEVTIQTKSHKPHTVTEKKK